LPAPEFDSSLVDLPPPQRQRSMLRRYKLMAERELAAALESAGPREMQLIEQVLSERRAATTARGPLPTSATPRQIDGEQNVADRVSKLPAAEARRLLRGLAADATSDAETRLQALTLLATSGDPELAAIARQRALEDSDPRVADLAMKILRERQQQK
jgi:hypothetical protein